MKKAYLLLFVLTILISSMKSQDQVTVTAMPDNPKDCFEPISTNYIKKISDVCFPFVQINFVTKATYKARYGTAVHGGPIAEVSVEISNLSDEDYQELANELQKLAEKKFSEGGYSTVGYDKVKSAKTYAKMIEASEKPGEETKIGALMRATGATHLKTFTAQNGPVYSAKTGGMKLYKLGKEVGVGQVIIVYGIDFSTYDIDKESKYNVESITKKISVEALPVISLGGEVWLCENGKSGGIRNKASWGTPEDFVLESKKIDDSTYEWVVDKEVFKKAVLSLMDSNLDLVVKYLSSIRK